MTSRIYPYIHDIDAKICEAERRVRLLTRQMNEGEPVEQERTDASGLYMEYVFYKLLQEDLPSDWTFFYNVNFECYNSFGRRERRQLDFLLVAPGCGVYNLECKGHYNWNGTEFYVGRDPNNTKPLINQCKTAVRDIVAFLKQHDNEVEGLTRIGNNGNKILVPNVGGALAFPTSEFEFDQVNEISQRIVGEISAFGTGLPLLDALSMKEGGLEAFIRQSAEGTGGLGPNLAEDIVGLLTRSATAKMKGAETNKLPTKALTKQMDGLVQCREELLPLVVHSPCQYMYVTGGAGTGKTWLAKSYVRQYANSFPDHKILFVCFNKLLAASLRLDQELAGIKNLNITNIQGVFREWRRDPGFTDRKIAPIMQGAQVDFNQEHSMQDNLDPLAFPSAGYDCIVIDEAQDLRREHFNFLTSLLRERNVGKIFICSGNEQNIYHGNEIVHGEWFAPNFRFDLSNTLRLTNNLRNSTSIHSYCKRIIGDRTTKSGVAYKGPDCQIEKGTLTLLKLITNLKEREGLENRDIAVLTDLKPDSEEFVSSAGVEWVRYLPDDGNPAHVYLDYVSSILAAWKNNQGIFLSTLNAFKGLEAACVVVYLRNRKTSPAEIYVASTRARFRLVIMPNDTGIRVDQPAKLLGEYRN